MKSRFFYKASSGALLLCVLGLLAGCASSVGWPRLEAGQNDQNPSFKPVEKAAATKLLSKEDLALLEELVNPVYKIGSGDVLKLDVFGRAEVSGVHTVGPDGKITIPIMGDVALNDLTREDALALINQGLRQYFSAPAATLAVQEYTSNQITVLGRVERAGIQKFANSPTLAEVLASAGAMPILDKQATLTRCAIMRGRDKLIWVDLKALLSGDPDFNVRMKKGDIVYIPDSSDTSVYVMGSVLKPGAYRLTPRMTVLDALAQSGGPTENAAPEKIGIYRAGAGRVEIIDFRDLVDVSRKVNFALEDGDVVFVPTSNLADLGYVMRQLSPAISVLTFGLTANTLGNQ